MVRVSRSRRFGFSRVCWYLVPGFSRAAAQAPLEPYYAQKAEVNGIVGFFRIVRSNTAFAYVYIFKFIAFNSKSFDVDHKFGELY